MIKTEIICNSCDNQYIIVTLDETELSFCPICSSPIDLDSEFDTGEEQ